MKIGIDGFSLNRSDSGIEVYVKIVIREVAKKFPVEVYNYDTLPLDVAPATLKHSGLGKELSTSRKLRWEISDVVKLISKDVDIFHSPHFTLPIWPIKSKKVVTLLDLAFIRHPEFFDLKSKLFFKLFLKQSLRRADAIICISESARRDVVEIFPFTKDKAVTVQLGYKDYSKISADNSILSDLDLKPGFILMIGTLNPRKNVRKGIQAFEKAMSGTDKELVIVGDLRRAHDFGHTPKNVKYTGFISEEKLSALYRSASMLLFPSYYEGFGFPILEAMSVGLPVVTSNTSSMPEVSGYPPELLCNPDNVNSISDIIIKMSNGQSGIDVRKHAELNVKRFSWDRMIAETLQVYESLQGRV